MSTGGAVTGEGDTRARALSRERYRPVLFDVAYCSRDADIMRGSRSGLQSVY